MRSQLKDRRGYILITRAHIKEEWTSSSQVEYVRETGQEGGREVVGR